MCTQHFLSYFLEIAKGVKKCFRIPFIPGFIGIYMERSLRSTHYKGTDDIVNYFVYLIR